MVIVICDVLTHVAAWFPAWSGGCRQDEKADLEPWFCASCDPPFASKWSQNLLDEVVNFPLQGIPWHTHAQ